MPSRRSSSCARSRCRRRTPTTCRSPARSSRSRGRSCRRGDATGVGEPLWELGLGGAVVRFPDYRGSDQLQHLCAAAALRRLSRPLPARRSRWRAGDPVRRPPRSRRPEPGRLGARPKQGQRRAARHARPARARSRSGPNVNVELWQSGDRALKLDLRLPLREAITLQRSPRRSASPSRPTSTSTCAASPAAGTSACSPGRCSPIGAITSTSMASRPSSRPRRGRPTTRPAAMPAGARRPPSRAASATPGWAASCATTTCTARRSPPARWCGANSNVTAGFGISWIFATSSQRVRTDD